MSHSAIAQQAPASDDANVPVQRVEITGSSIKRINKEGALPVQVLTQEDIKKTGATSVTDLLQNLPAMQGFVPAASSINTGGGGATTAALHSLQSKYTLVLLDGQRMAPIAQGSAQGGGFAVNLESIPLDAIERVEILTDGASALYGSDAIAGVVNFITKKNKTDTNVFFSNQTPEHPGGRAYSAGISKGWGNLDTDGFNVLASYSHDFQHAIKATDRDFSKAGGYIPFSYGGQNYVQIATSANNEPGNLSIPTVPHGSPAGTAPTTYQFSPYYNAHGNCGNAYSLFLPVTASAGTAAGGNCNFNFASFVQDNPSTNRDSGLLKASFKINEDTTAWAELVLSDTDVVAQFAPPSQPLGITPTKYANLYSKYVQPFLTANGLDIDGVVKMSYRPIAVGGRADDFDTFARHFSTGIDGQLGGWGYNARLTLSHSQLKDIAAGGYLDTDKFNALVASGSVDPLGGSSGNLLTPALLNGSVFSTTESDFDSLHFGGQHDTFVLPGGTSILSIGADVSYQHYKTGYDDLSASSSGYEGQPTTTDAPIGGNNSLVPSDTSRKNGGVYGEWLFPVLKSLEVTASGRFDSYGRAHSNDIFGLSPGADGLIPKLPNGDIGNSSHGTTYKVSFRWNPHEDVLFRGAYGTGFKAPALTDLAGPLSYNGSSGSFACPFPGLPTCGAASSQYDLLAGGNGNSGSSGLKPEKSKQWTFGLVVDPIKGLTLGADIWAVTIRDQVLSSGIAQNEAFDNPQTYAGLFVKNYLDPVGGYPTIALEQVPINGGVAHYKGIDWDNSYRTNLPIGKLNVAWTGTWMWKQDYTTAPGGEVFTDLAKFGEDQAVVFRTQMRLSATLQTGKFSNTLAANYKSGYKDQSFSAGEGIYPVVNGVVSPNSVDFAGLDVPSYTTWDWQGKFDYSKALSFTAGIHNLTDKKPPLTLQAQVAGNSAGYDPRYADVIGRAFYVRGNYNF